MNRLVNIFVDSLWALVSVYLAAMLRWVGIDAHVTYTCKICRCQFPPSRQKEHLRLHRRG